MKADLPSVLLAEPFAEQPTRSRQIRPINAELRAGKDGNTLPLSACDCDNYHSCSCDSDTCGNDVNVCGVDFNGSGYIDTEVEICAAFGWG